MTLFARFRPSAPPFEPPQRPLADTQPTMTRAAIAKEQVELISIAQGFVASSVLFALMRLDVFALLRDAPMTAAEIARQAGASPDRLARLLDAGVALQLLEFNDDRYHVTPARRALLADRADDAYLGDWLRFTESWYAPFGSIDLLVKGAIPADMYSADPEVVRQNTLAMHNYAVVRGSELVEFLDLTTSSSMLDVGCGPGTYSFELAKRYPQLELSLLDRACVLDVAREILAGYDISNEVRFIAGDIENTTSISDEFDVVLASNVLQAFDAAHARGIVKDLFRLVRPGGSLIVQAQFPDDDRRGPRWPVFVDLACLCFTSSGRNHTVADTTAWLTDAGFSDIEHQPMSLLNANAFVRGYRR